jgi:hypothetical protein
MSQQQLPYHLSGRAAPAPAPASGSDSMSDEEEIYSSLSPSSSASYEDGNEEDEIDIQTDDGEVYAEVEVRFDDGVIQDRDSPKKAIPTNLLSKFLVSPDVSSQSQMSRSEGDSLALSRTYTSRRKKAVDQKRSEIPRNVVGEVIDVERDIFKDNELPHRSSIPIILGEDEIAAAGIYHLEKDVFSMIFVSPVLSSTFVYAIFIVGVQISILTLALINQLREGVKGNWLDLPPHTTVEVNIAQGIALLLSVITAKDVIVPLKAFQVVYNPEIRKKFPAATYTRWIFSHVLRFSEGVFLIFAAFIFIVKSSDVLDLFLDFAVVQFVGALGNFWFHLALKGYLQFPIVSLVANGITKSVAFDYKRVESQNTAPGFQRIGIPRVERVRKLIFFLLLSILYGGWITTKALQSQGYYYNFDCQRFQVKFEDYQYDFFEKVCSSRQEKDCPQQWTQKGQALSYGSFDDVYEKSIRANGDIVLHNHRPKYTQRGLAGIDAFGEDSPSGEIKYCEEENAWVFAISGIDRGQANIDDCNWLMKSPKTNALTLGDVPKGGWQIWTGQMSKGGIDVTCIECEQDDMIDIQDGSVSCNYNGICNNDKTCKCVFPFMGAQCGVCAACQVLELKNYQNNDGNKPQFFLEGKMVRLDKEPNKPFELYNRPVYYHGLDYASDIWLTSDNLYVLMYSENRWGVWNMTNRLNIVADGQLELLDYLETFHSAWNTNNTTLPDFISVLTDSPTPKNLVWKNSKTGDVAGFEFTCLDEDFEEEMCGLLF